MFYEQDIYRAIINKDDQLVKNLLQCSDLSLVDDVDQSSYLILAVKIGAIKVADILIKSSIDINSRNDLGDMAIHFSAKYQGVEMAKVLVAGGADINAMGQSATPFNYALYFKNIDVAKYFYLCGVDVDVEDELGNTGFLLMEKLKLNF